MQNRRSYLILVGLILAAVAGVAALAIPGSPAHKKVTLGLDLQGGLEVVLKAQPAKGQKLDSAALDRSVSIMRQRVDKLGVAEPEIRKQGSNQIVIELAGVHDPAKAAAIIGKTAQLELYDLETSLTGPSISASGNPQQSPSLYALLSQVQSEAKKGTPEGYYVVGKNKEKSVGPFQTRAAALSQAKAANLKKPYTVLAVPQNTVVVTCDSTEVVCPGNSGQQGGNTIPPPAQAEAVDALPLTTTISLVAPSTLSPAGILPPYAPSRPGRPEIGSWCSVAAGPATRLQTIETVFFFFVVCVIFFGVKR